MRAWTLPVAIAACCAVLAAPLPAQVVANPGTPLIDDEFAPPQVRLDIALGSGARALGMGGAFLARPDDATAASWNPAGLSYLRRPEVSAAGVFSRSDTADRAVLRPRGETVTPSTDTLEAKSPDFLAAAYPLNLGGVTGAAQVSFQRVIAFDGGRDIFRNQARIRLDTGGGFDVVTGGVGLQATRRLRLGVVVNRWRNGYDVDFERTERRPETSQTRFDLSGWSVNAGLIFSPWEDVNVGIVGKTPFTGQVTLTRHRENFSDTENPKKADATSSTVRLDFPGAIGFGASWRVTSPLTVSVDWTRTFWSRGRIRNFFDLVLEGVDSVEGGPRSFPELSYPTLTLPEAREQEDTQQIRAGLEYVVVKDRFKWPLRLGYFSDRQYFLAQGGAPTFHALTLGTGILVGPVLLDVAYVGEWGRYGYVDADGLHRVTSSSHRVFTSFIYRFSGSR